MSITIIGAGLSGLLTGYLLKKEGIPFKILEARNRVGGRINTIYDANKAPLDMGATWFTKQHTHVIGLLKELEIEHFEQRMDNNVFYETSAASPAQLVQIPSQSPSFRISGGTSCLIKALLHKLDQTDVVFNQSVTHIKIDKNTVEVHAEKNFESRSVVLALPPKLWVKKIIFEPGLPTDLMGVAIQTHTWMEDSIKIALSYDEPFWKIGNIPGTLFSNSGPITELYDHSNHERSKYALCGFIDSSLKNLTYTDRRERVINQIKKIYGVEAEGFTSYRECVWSKEENTFESSETFLYPHQNNGNPIFRESYFDDTLFISSSESATEFAGYMDGAVSSAYQIVKKITKGY
ncbi:MAG: monoamine oxidase [Maribacter sp.]|jgi:monoamine oxidase